MKNKFILVFLITILIFSQLSIGYSLIDLNKADEFGEIWGQISGYDDYLNNRDNDWYDAYDDVFDTDDDLFEFFDIEDENDDELDDFERDFKDGFESDYEKAYEDIEDWSNSEILSEADNLGRDFGRFDANNDYFNSESSDWEEAYEERFDQASDLFNYFEIDDEDNENLNDFESEFISEYEDSYEDEYENVEESDDEDNDGDNSDAKEATEDKAKEDAKTFAEIDAKQSAYIDYHSNEDNDWTDLYPSDSKIKSKYNLEDDSNDYEDVFLEEYEKHYQIVYERQYRNANVESVKSKEINAYDHGYQLGLSQGESAGYLDLINDVFSNWKSSYDSFIRNKDLERKYYLYRQNDEYIKSFKAGFKTAYEIGYETTYADTNVQIENNNLNFKRLTSNEMVIEYSSYGSDFLSGGMASNTTVPLYLEFDKGTVFSVDKHLGINEEQYQIGGTYGKSYASRVYNIKFQDYTESVEFKKPVKLAFNFNSNANVGIYKFEQGQWFYLPTKFEEGTVYTNIPKGEYSGGKYTLLIDNTRYLSHENKLHWSFPEIKLFHKREMIYGPSFVPSEGYRRKEFCQLILKNTIGHKDFKYEPVINFKDSDKFGRFKNAISYMVNNGYMNGVGDQKFAPDEYITYKEVEIVMGRILNEDFKWEEISASLEKKRFTKSSANADKSNNINKAETLFMIQEVLGSNALFK